MAGTIRAICILISLIVGLLAVYGGMMLVMQPTGETMQFPLELLEPTPFDDYFIPGLILMVILGFYGWAAGAALWMRKKRAPILTIGYGVLLIGWLTIEVLMNPALFWPRMHYSLYTAGVFMIVGGLLLRRA